jgi:hypothetical protein
LEVKENLKLPLTIVIFLAAVWVFYVVVNRVWITAFQQAIFWMINPKINFGPIYVKGVPLAFLATIEMLILGIVSSNMLLGDEEDILIKFVSALGLGFGFVGFVTIVLSIFCNLYLAQLSITILALIAIFLLVNTYLRRGVGLTSRNFLKINFSLGKFRKPANLKLGFAACLAICVIFLFCFYHAIFTVITHWDAIVYHAVIPIFMYRYHAFPIMAGPSIGIEMSANFPPLFSAFGAYYYVQICAVEDFYLKIVPPIMGILTVLMVYKIGSFLDGEKYGILSALFLAMTPLFFRYSIYATSYSTLAFYMTISVLFLLLGITRMKSKYWVMSGVFYGFALLTSYLALYLVPFFILAVIYNLINVENKGKSFLKSALLLFLSTLTIGGVWYFRNWVLLGNPVYPNGYAVFDGINIDPLIIETTFRGIKLSAAWSFFGGGSSSFLIRIATFITYRNHFPALSLFTVLGIMLLPTCQKKSLLLLVLAWPVIVSIFIFSGITWSFPRHALIAMPGFALISSLPVIKVLEKCEKYDEQVANLCKNAFERVRSLSLIYKSDLLRLGIILIILLAFLFPSLTFVMGGKSWMDNLNDAPSGDYLWFLENPNTDTWSVLFKLYPEALAWKWLNEHLREGEKFATVENRIYYVKNCSNDFFFYLDGWEARELYSMVDPISILKYLQSRNVKYVVDIAWARTHGHFDILPLARFLGSPYFPLILDRAGNPNIYNVGPIETPITANSSVLISISQDGWSPLRMVNDRLVQTVIANKPSARLYVEALNLTSVRITYLDDGNGGLSIDLCNPYSRAWIHNYTFIQKRNTNEWKAYEFLVPICEKGFVEFNLYANPENFTICHIEATQLNVQGRASFYSLKKEFSNFTFPPSLIVYLPILQCNQKIMVQTNSYERKIRVQIFEGVVQLWEREGLDLKKNHRLVIDSYKQQSPSLYWKVTKSGLYTLVITLYGEPNPSDVQVDLQIIIEG